MNRIRDLIKSYSQYIAVPWRDDAAAPQRVVFCVYDETDELRLRARIDDFKLETKQAGHDWLLFDLTETFADWLTSQRYAVSYFQKPQLLTTLLPKYREYITTEFESFIREYEAGEDTVVAIKGVGSLFGFLKVREVVEQLAPMVKGRLLVFFPGSYEDNNYRLLDGYDGWNYHAIPITADRVY